jgi:hypothetical protein
VKNKIFPGYKNQGLLPYAHYHSRKLNGGLVQILPWCNKRLDRLKTTIYESVFQVPKSDATAAQKVGKPTQKQVDRCLHKYYNGHGDERVAPQDRFGYPDPDWKPPLKTCLTDADKAWLQKNAPSYDYGKDAEEDDS